jgi:hypothetical protein
MDSISPSPVVVGVTDSRSDYVRQRLSNKALFPRLLHLARKKLFDEIFLFWEAVERYRHRPVHPQTIVRTYLVPGAQLEVNLNRKVWFESAFPSLLLSQLLFFGIKRNAIVLLLLLMLFLSTLILL